MSQLGFSFADVPESTEVTRPLAPRIAATPSRPRAHVSATHAEIAAPVSTDAALTLYRGMIDRHHAALLAGDESAVMDVRKEAHALAVSMNGGTLCGICADGGPGKMLERETRVTSGTVPLWGQTGDFIIDVDGMRVRIEQDGIFGIGASGMPWPGFSAHIVDRDKPFLSETGYRSFLGLTAAMVPGLFPDTFAAEIVRGFIASERKPARKTRKAVQA